MVTEFDTAMAVALTMAGAPSIALRLQVVLELPIVV